MYGEEVLVAQLCLFVTPWTVAHQPPLSMQFSRKEYCNGLPFPSPGDLHHLGIKPRSPALQADFFFSQADFFFFFPTEPPGEEKPTKIKEMSLVLDRALQAPLHSVFSHLYF